MAENVFDAIVVGSGIGGGWAAKELCESGLKTIMLERGQNVEHIKDYVNVNKAPWEFKHRGKAPIDSKSEYGRRAGSLFHHDEVTHPVGIFYISNRIHKSIALRPRSRKV